MVPSTMIGKIGMHRPMYSYSEYCSMFSVSLTLALFFFHFSWRSLFTFRSAGNRVARYVFLIVVFNQ